MLLELSCAVLVGIVATVAVGHFRRVRARRQQWLLPAELAAPPAISPPRAPLASYCQEDGNADSTCAQRALQFPEPAPSSPVPLTTTTRNPSVAPPSTSQPTPPPSVSRPGDLVEPEQYELAPPLPAAEAHDGAASVTVAAMRERAISVDVQLVDDDIDWDDGDEPADSSVDSHWPSITDEPSLTDDEWQQVAHGIPLEGVPSSATQPSVAAVAPEASIDVGELEPLAPESLTPLPLSDLVAEMCAHSAAQAGDELDLNPVSYVRELAVLDEDDTAPFVKEDFRATTRKSRGAPASDSVRPPHMALPAPATPPSLPPPAMILPPPVSGPPPAYEIIDEDDTQPNLKFA